MESQPLAALTLLQRLQDLPTMALQARIGTMQLPPVAVEAAVPSLRLWQPKLQRMPRQLALQLSRTLQLRV